jgi:hypothetical protein
MLITVVLFSSSSFVVFLQAVWIIIKRNAEYKPLQFLAFAFVYRIFEKLKAFEPPASPTYSVSPILCDICRLLINLCLSRFALLFHSKYIQSGLTCRKRVKIQGEHCEWENACFVLLH